MYDACVCRYILAFVIIIFLHLAANLFNTYYDFSSGADTPAEADDRALVDNTVSPTFVWRAAVSCALVGVSAATVLSCLRGKWLAPHNTDECGDV